MKKYNTIEDAQNKHRELGKYESEVVEINNKKVILSGTNQKYEDILFGGVLATLENLKDSYRKDLNELGVDVDTMDISSQVRDFVLEILENQYNVEFVEQCEEY